MRFDTNFIWAFYAPTILITLVSYDVSVFHTYSSKILTLKVGFYHSELNVQLWTIRKKILSHCARELYTVQCVSARGLSRNLN